MFEVFGWVETFDYDPNHRLGITDKEELAKHLDPGHLEEAEEENGFTMCGCTTRAKGVRGWNRTGLSARASASGRRVMFEYTILLGPLLWWSKLDHASRQPLPSTEHLCTTRQTRTGAISHALPAEVEVSVKDTIFWGIRRD